MSHNHSQRKRCQVECEDEDEEPTLVTDDGDDGDDNSATKPAMQLEEPPRKLHRKSKAHAGIDLKEKSYLLVQASNNKCPDETFYDPGNASA